MAKPNCFALLALLFLSVDTGTAQRTAPKVIWQESQAVSVQLGIRDKFGTLGNYEVVFEVSAVDGRKITTEKRGMGDQFTYVSFPDDFDFTKQISLRSAGTFAWRAIVRGKAIAHGSFRWASTAGEAKVFSE